MKIRQTKKITALVILSALILLFAPIVNAQEFLSDCQKLEDENTTYNLNQDILVDPSINLVCFDINAKNITLDCQGHIIESIDSGSGVGVRFFAYLYNPFNIKNCVIKGFNTGLFFGASFIDYSGIGVNGSILNNELINNNRGLYIYLKGKKDVISNKMCGNINYDIETSQSGEGDYIKNTCDSSKDFNDNNLIGCTFSCDMDEDGYLYYEDCNDNNQDINPGAEEVCDGIDNNCDGCIDGVWNPNTEECDNSCPTINYYCDADEDGFFASTPTNYCDYFGCIPSGCITEQGTDCDDEDPEINPGAEEVCDGIDNNCDGTIDNVNAGTSVETSKCQCYGGAEPLKDGLGNLMELFDNIDNTCDGCIDGMWNPETEQCSRNLITRLVIRFDFETDLMKQMWRDLTSNIRMR